MNIVDRIAGNQYAATEKDIEHLARLAADGSRAGSTYLRCLVAAVQAELRGATDARPRRGRPRKQQAARATAAVVLESVHTRMYAAVKRGLGAVADINRRATFARSAASTLRRWIAAGNRAEDIDLATCTKRSLAVHADPSEQWRRTLAQFVIAAQRAGAGATNDAIHALRDVASDPGEQPKAERPLRVNQHTASH